jgi:Holliday junction resolvase RusA-like endonuclease
MLNKLSLSQKELVELCGTTGFIYFKSNESKKIILNITPVPKPRMVKSDAWRKRKCVLAYWAFKDNLNILAKNAGLNDLPANDFHVIYRLPMPASWSKKKAAEMDGKPHQQRPDCDNLQKALQDCLCKTDEHIWDFRVTKLWAETGSIEIRILSERNT